MAWLVPLGLYLLALAIRLVAAEQIPSPATEPSAYYADVARNLLSGEGIVSHSVWSYATPPLEVPKPAFELWLPMSTFVSLVPMSLLGPGYWSAQVGGALLGALVAPLAWAIAREAAHAQGLDARRGRAVAVATGIITAALSPLVLGAAVPDSYTPFTVFILLAALLLPRTLGVRAGTEVRQAASRPASLALGVAMGLAYLSRQEVIWFGLTVVVMTGWLLHGHPRGTRLREGFERLWPVVAGGLVVVVPWLVRNTAALGSAFPGQAVENMFLVRNEDIFAFTDRPSLAGYLDQGLATVLLNPLVATAHSLIATLSVSAFPIGVVGLVALVGMRHSRALRTPTALVALLVSGGLTFVSTMLLFPVATQWGTFMHASGPLLVALSVVAALGGDAALARVSTRRRWARPNVILAPVALISVTALFAVFQVQVLSRQSEDADRRYATIATSLREVALAQGADQPATVITDRPMSIADATDGYAIALPDEPVEALAQLAAVFEAPWVVVVGERGRYPEALLRPEAARCLSAEPVPLTNEEPAAWLFQLDPACASP